MDNDIFNKMLEKSDEAMNKAWKIAVSANVERRELTSNEQSEIKNCIDKSNITLASIVSRIK